MEYLVQDLVKEETQIFKTKQVEILIKLVDGYLKRLIYFLMKKMMIGMMTIFMKRKGRLKLLKENQVLFKPLNHIQKDL